MSAKPFRMLVAATVVAWIGVAGAAPDAAAERERIATERRAIEAVYAQRQLECQQRFAVTACIDAARADQREALGRLRRQESVLDEAARRQRAAERMAAIREKISSEEARKRETATAPRAPAIRAVAPRAGPGTRSAATLPAHAASDPQREAEEARSRARFEARQRDAAAHRDAVAQRAAEQARQGKKPAAPLPAPGAASATH